MKSLKQFIKPERFRKEGSVFIEYIIVLPIMILSLVFFCGLALFFYDGIQTNILSNQISNTVIQETRGNPKTFGEVDPEEKELIRHIVAEQVLNSYVSPFAELRFDGEMNKLSDSDILDSLVMDDPSLCENKIDNNQRVICIDSVSLMNNDLIKEEIKVEIYAPYKSFHFVDQFIDSIHSQHTAVRDLGRTNNIW